MTEYITESEYKEYLAMGIEFENCLIACAQEINMLSWGRELVGEFNGDIDIYDGEDRYLVQFEDRSGCESNTDSVYVPQEYIYDEKYREYYRKFLIEEKELKAAAALKRKEQREARTYRVIVNERAEYERLKEKFGDD